MKKKILFVAFAILSIAFFTTDIAAQDVSSTTSSTKSSTSYSYEDTEDETKVTFVNEWETDNKYRMNYRFHKKKTKEVENYLIQLLGECSENIGDVRKVWNTLPGMGKVSDMEITLRSGHLQVKSKNMKEKVLEELRAIKNDVKSILN